MTTEYETHCPDRDQAGQRPDASNGLTQACLAKSYRVSKIVNAYRKVMYPKLGSDQNQLMVADRQESTLTSIRWTFWLAIMIFKDVIDEFTNWRTFKINGTTTRGNDKDLRLFCLFLRNPHVEAITLNNVMEYLNLMKEIGWQHNSFVSKCMALKKFFEFCNLRGYRVLNENLIPIPQKQYKIPRVATPEEYKKLLSVIPKNTDPRNVRNEAIVRLLWDTGARNGEILALDMDDLDFENNKALIKTEKAKTRRPLREIFWTRETSEAIQKWIARRERFKQGNALRDPNALFISIHNSGANKTRGYRFKPSGVCEMLRGYSNKAGLEKSLNAHSMRHYMGRNIIEKGGSNSDVTNILGHSCIESSMVYTMMYGKQAEKRYRKFRGN